MRRITLTVSLLALLAAACSGGGTADTSEPRVKLPGSPGPDPAVLTAEGNDSGTTEGGTTTTEETHHHHRG